MSYGSGAMWGELGKQLFALGSRLDEDKLKNAALARQGAEDVRRHDQEDLSNDVELAKLGGGRGAAPTDMQPIAGTGTPAPMPEARPIFTPRPMTPSPLAPPPGGSFAEPGTDAAVGYGNEQPGSIFKARGLGMDPTGAGAPVKIAAPLITDPIMHDANAGRFQQVASGKAYIERPEVMKKEDLDAAEARTVDAKRQELDFQRQALDVDIPALTDRIMKVTGAPRDKATAEAGMIAHKEATYESLNPHESVTPADRAAAQHEKLSAAAKSKLHQRVVAAQTALQRIDQDASQYGDKSRDQVNADRATALKNHGFFDEEDLTNAQAVSEGEGEVGDYAPPKLERSGPPEEQVRASMAGMPQPQIDSVLTRAGRMRRAEGGVAAPAPAAAAAPTTSPQPAAATGGAPAAGAPTGQSFRSYAGLLSDATVAAARGKIAGKSPDEQRRILAKAGLSDDEQAQILGR